MDTNSIVEGMQRVALAAGSHLRTLKPRSTRLSTRKDFLLKADLESDEIIRGALAAAFPNIRYSSEENENDKKEEGEWFWVDPVDATVNFFLGVSPYAVSIAYVVDGETKAGVILLPSEMKLFWAEEGKPAWMNDLLHASPSGAEQIKVNEEADLASNQIWFEWGKENSGGKDHDFVRSVMAKVDRKTLYPQVRNCAAGNPMMVATGVIGGFIMTKPDPYDLAAAGLIVRQAGGTVTDLEGNPWRATSQSMVATNGVIHKQLLEVIHS